MRVFGAFALYYHNRRFRELYEVFTEFAILKPSLNRGEFLVNRFKKLPWIFVCLNIFACTHNHLPWHIGCFCSTVCSKLGSTNNTQFSLTFMLPMRTIAIRVEWKDTWSSVLRTFPSPSISFIIIGSRRAFCCCDTAVDSTLLLYLNARVQRNFFTSLEKYNNGILVILHFQTKGNVHVPTNSIHAHEWRKKKVQLTDSNGSSRNKHSSSSSNSRSSNIGGNSLGERTESFEAKAKTWTVVREVNTVESKSQRTATTTRPVISKKHSQTH